MLLATVGIALLPRAGAGQAADSGSGRQSGVASTPTDAPRTVPEALNFANGLLRERLFARAAEEYERFLKETSEGPDAADAHFGLANARLFLGKYKDARAHFEAFRAMAPGHPNAPTALYRIGETAYMLGDLAAARKALEEYTAGSPGHRYQETAWTYLGDVCFQLKDMAAARRAYRKALDDFPEGRLADRARYGLGQTLAAQGQADEALKIFADLADRRVRDWDDRARFQIGMVQAGAGREAEAIQAFEELERTAPKSSLIAEARLRRGEALARLGRPDEAAALLRPLVADPTPALATQAADALATLLLKKGQAAEARTMLDETLRRHVGSAMTPVLLFHSAEAAQKEGRADLARARFAKVAEIAPDDPWAADALLRAASLSLEANDLAAARAQASALVARHAGSPLVADAHLIEGRAALAGKQAKAAIAILTRLLAEDRPGAETARIARYYLARAYRDDGQADKADEILESLSKSPAAPAATEAQFLVGEKHFQAGRFAEAIEPLETYLAGKPRDEAAAHALAYLAAARQALGQDDAAQAALDQLAAQFPRSKTLPPTRLRLAEAALAAKHLDRAADLFRRAAETDDPKLKVRALSGLGWTLIQARKPVEAAAAFAARLDVLSDDDLAPQDALARARALEDADRADDALAAYGVVVARYTKTDQAGSAALARARLLTKLQRFDEAAQTYAGYVLDHPKGGKGGPEDDGLDAVLTEWGWSLLDARKAADADQVFERLLEQFPDSPKANDARLNLAESANEAKAYDRVIQLLEPLVAEGSKADPAQMQAALYRLGRTAVAKADWTAAARMFDRLVKDYPQSPFWREARFWKAEVAFQGGDAKAAEAEFAALAADPAAAAADKAERWLLTARLRRVQSLILLGQWKEALDQADALKASVPDHPQMPEIDFARGRALQQLARFEDARAAYKAVIDARKGSELAARAQLMRGETFFHEKNYTEAIRELQMAHTLYDAPPWQAAALLEEGKVHERLSQWQEAADTYKKLREKFPSDPCAAEAARRLDEVQKQQAAAPPPAESPPR